MGLSLIALAALAAAILVTSFISGILGMAGGMMLMGVLLVLLPLPAAMMLHGIAQLAANGSRALMLWREIDRRVIAGYAAGAVVVLGAFVVTRCVADKTIALITMGLTPFAALALPDRLQLDVERPWHPLACGAACTVLALTAGVAGPVLDVFFARSAMSRHRVVATKAATQSLGHVMKIVYFGGVVAAGNDAIPIWLAVSVVVLAVTGTSLSRRVLERISDASFRAWTRWTIMGIGAAYLASGLSAAWR